MEQTISLEDILKAKGFKSTKHRSAVFNVIKENSTAISADDIYFKLKEKGISISPSSIYKILDTLSDCDIVHKYFSIDTNKTLYQLNNVTHKHQLICRNCKKCFPLSTCPLAAMNSEIENSMNFHITNHIIEIYGYCGDCK